MSGKHHSLEDVQNIANSKGGICLSSVYKNANEKMDFKCSEGHFFKKDFKRILHRNEWCQKCSKNTSEEICRYILETLLDIQFEKTTFNYKGHNLELDGYNEKNKIAFEYNGKQHYELTAYIKTEKELDYRKHLDELKIEYCKLNGINLIIVPYTIKNDDLVVYIKKTLKIKNSKNVDINGFINNYSYYKKRKLEVIEFLRKNDIKLINFNLDNIEIKCKNNHIWKSTYYLAKKGHFCRICADKNNERKFIDVLNILKKNDITCLSDEKQYTASGESILEFKCKNGHIFNDTVDYLLARIAGKNKENKRKPCQLCNRPKQDNALEKIKLNGLVLVNTGEYKHRTDLLVWICEHGHKQEDKAKNLLQNIRRGAELCKTCKN